MTKPRLALSFARLICTAGSAMDSDRSLMIIDDATPMPVITGRCRGQSGQRHEAFGTDLTHRVNCSVQETCPIALSNIAVQTFKHVQACSNHVNQGVKIGREWARNIEHTK